MSTDELERLERVERLLESALHEADPFPIDLRDGRARLAPRLVEQQRSVRRRWVTCVAVSALAVVVVTTSILLAGLRGDKDSLPAAPSPDLTFSSSGLPVGLLQGKVDRTEPQARSTVRIVVRPDGTGTWNAGTVGDSEGPSVHDYEVEFLTNGPGSAVMRQPEAWCAGAEQLTLQFAVHGHTVVIKDARTTNCLVKLGLAKDLAGTTLRILPLPGT